MKNTVVVAVEVTDTLLDGPLSASNSIENALREAWDRAKGKAPDMSRLKLLSHAIHNSPNHKTWLSAIFKIRKP